MSAGPSSAGPSSAGTWFAEQPSAEQPSAEQPLARPSAARAKLFIGPALTGAVVAVALGVYGRVHTPTGVAVDLPGFSGLQAAKVWLASVSALFALTQPVSALVMSGKMPFVRQGPRWIGGLHRWSGRLAFFVAVPVAVHCLYALGFQAAEPRVLIHSLLGCLFFGAFTTKMLSLRKDGLPWWVLPLLGGAVFTVLIGLWLSASLWFFSTSGVHL